MATVSPSRFFRPAIAVLAAPGYRWLVESVGVGGYAFAPPRMYGAELRYRF